jgi:hypothetical protein
MAYYNYNGAYFSDGGAGVTDPNILNQLKSGALASTVGNPFASSYSQPPAIGSEVLNSGTNPSFNSYTPSSTFPVGSLNPFSLTQPEQQTQSQINDILGLQNQLVGESQYKADAEQQFDIAGLTQTQKDLASKLKSLQNEALSIPLQQQKNALGQGVTVAGLKPIEIAALRENAIAALSTSALLEAANGNLSLAMQQVDQAVAQKFNPIKEEVAVKLANLELILNSPEYTNAQKAKAQAQLDYQNQLAQKAAQQEENFKTAQAMATAAVQLNPDDQGALIAAQQALKLDVADPNYLSNIFGLIGKYQSDPQTIQMEILKQEQIKADIALTYANIAKIKDLNQVLSISDAQKLGVPYGTTKEQAIAMGKTPGVAAEAGLLKQNALESAKGLLEKFQSSKSAVGFSKIFGTQLIPGTPGADFKVQFNNLKSLLSLDNVKYLKGQGQVSDAERALLEQASAKLNSNQSEAEFSKSLNEIIQALSGSTGGIPPGTDGILYGFPGYVSDGKQWVKKK